MTASIVVNQISKRYRIGTGLTSLRELFSLSKSSHNQKHHWALKNVSFELQPGEALGIIGPNGAGKTTILKILSRVSVPTSGELTVHGRLSALIELGAGFHPDLSGRENIFLNGTILGMRRADIKARFDEIVAFAGIGAFLDTPVKRYSSGMYARLGFAIAAHVDPQVLLVDEVLAVGDYPFQIKCYARMEELRRKGTTLIFVSHNLEAVREVCDRGLVMYRGEAIFQGTATDAIIAYSEAIRDSARQATREVPGEEGLSQRVMTFDAEIERVSLLDAQDRRVTVLQSGTPARVAMDVVFKKDAHAPVFSLTIRTPDGRVVYDTTTHWMHVQTPDFLAGDRYRVEFSLNLPLLSGIYELRADIAASDLSHFYDYLERALSFSVVGGNGAKGLVDLEAKVEFQKLATQGEQTCLR
jgi:ABC-type polysaccharide/polyol phosphate transport system ATPase subunit